MVLKIKTVGEMLGMKVFTDSGEFLGDIEEANVIENKVDGWRIRVARESALSLYLGGARGLIVPHRFMKAVGDVVVVSRAAIPSKEEALNEELPTHEETL